MHLSILRVKNDMNVYIRKLVIDSLKPHEFSKFDLSKSLCTLDGVEELTLSVTEVDSNTETVRLTLIGPDIKFEEVLDVLKECGAAVKSVDEIVTKSNKN